VLAVEKLLSANAGAEDALERAIDADPGFALAHAARAHGHVEALALNLESDMPRTLAHVLEHLRECPRDGLVLSLTSGIFGLIGFSGRRDRNEALLDLLDGLAVSYGEDWWFSTSTASPAPRRTSGRAAGASSIAPSP
jgi:hypothetical protein